MTLKRIEVTFVTHSGEVKYFTHEYGWSLEQNTTKEQTYFGNIMDKIVALINEESYNEDE